jgi:hypothetical protein
LSSVGQGNCRQPFAFSSSAFAVDGAGLQLSDIAFLLAYLLLAASPFIAVVGALVIVVLLVRRLVGKPPKRAADQLDVLPPATGDIQFTEEQASLMQRWNIFFNGRQYRMGGLKFDTLAEALAAAQKDILASNDSN